jgi:hypothetical protein
MDTTGRVEPPAPSHEAARSGRSGEGARSVMEQLMQLERKRDEQRAADAEGREGTTLDPQEG